MREGPSSSGCRIRAQTTRSCFGPMALVVSVLGKGGTTRQVCTGKTNVSEPLGSCRKRRDAIETRLQLLAWDKSGGAACLLPGWWPAQRRREPSAGSCAERGNLRPDAKGDLQSGRPIRSRVPMRGEGTDGLVGAMKPGNAGGAKGPDTSALGAGQPAMGGARA